MLNWYKANSKYKQLNEHIGIISKHDFSERQTKNCIFEPGMLVSQTTQINPIYVGDYNTPDECANATMQYSQLNASGVNYGFGYEINNKTSCYAFSNCGDKCAIQKLGNNATSCLFRGKYFHLSFSFLLSFYFVNKYYCFE